MRRSLLVVLAAGMAMSLAPGVSLGAAPDTPDTLRWGPCPKKVAAPGVECATLDVPLNYSKPDGKKIEIAISRLKSTNPEKRRGVLLTNSGGPGGEGMTLPAALRKLGLPKSVLDSYDVIGIDPRGVGHSTPVTCGLKPTEWFTNIPTFAKNSADVQAHAKVVADIAKKCGSSESAELLPHITTANTARDMDRIREALGESKVSYYGMSYGTYLGSVYTSMFPNRSDRFVLDSATAPTGWDAAFARRFAEGFHDRFPDFAEFAAAHPKYGLGDTPAEVTAKYFELGARLDATPRPDGVDGVLFRHLTFAEPYFESRLPALAAMWQAINEGKPLPSETAGVAQQAATQQDSAVPTDNYLASQLHVICNDSNWPESVENYQRNVAIDRVRYPLFGAAAANITPCAFWPSEPREPQVDITDRGPSNVLIVQNERDPATPLSGAQELREAFGDRARMVTADQGGHVVYLLGANQCANDSMTRFLVTGQRPERDLACAAEPA